MAMALLALKVAFVLLSVTNGSSKKYPSNGFKGLNLTKNGLNESCDAEIEKLKLAISNSSRDISRLQQENFKLVSHIDRLTSQCVCQSTCTVNGRVYMDEEVWHPHSCQICQCQTGNVKCETLLMPGCEDPCSPNPCQNGGTCQQNSDYTDFTCHCPPQQAGRLCQIHINVCIQPRRYGDCSGHRTMWYFNGETQKCESYVYSGCGASPNNFHTLNECENRCSVGTCCFHHFGNGITQKSIVIKCLEQSLRNCQKLHHQASYEVVAFHPGMRCPDRTCYTLEKGGCQVGNNFYLPNTEFKLGCEKCTCNKFSTVTCSCDHVTIRKEVRDLTFGEMKKFQDAVSELYAMENGRIWQMLVEMYSSYIMHCHVISNFLIWNRLFLRHVERHLQNINCDVSIPYYDFTTDAGNISDSFIWQPNYFGGSGENQNSCVPDHPFRGKKFIPWKPCLQRQFNKQIQIPGMVEIAIAMSNTNYIQFSIAMQHIVSCLHNFIGGHMTLQAAPYDPVFYAIHAYIDMLFWRWEERQKQSGVQILQNMDSNKILFPFNVTLEAALESENILCVTYYLPSEGKPCNYTDDHSFGPSGYNAKGFDRQGFDKDGYDKDGYNIFGYNRSGHYDERNRYDLNGFDMEGYNRAGYDRRGYNRYGFHRNGYNQECYDVRGYDCEGFDRYGLDNKAFDIHGIDHHTAKGKEEWLNYYNNRFSPGNCLNFDGLTPDNFDQFGYDVHGYDWRGCSYGKNGPFSLIQAHRIQEILYKQNLGLLLKIPHICNGVTSVSEKWNRQVWNDENIDFPGFQSHTDKLNEGDYRTLWSKKFCFDADMFLSACPCEKDMIATCNSSEISFSCEHYPNAKPVLNTCHMCRLHWHIDGKIVNCSEPPDYCRPNPCLNNGTCIPSVWSLEPESVQCLCKPGYEGPFCEHEASQVCYLPLDRGTDMCGHKHERWYFNIQRGQCEPFTYNGCFGNSNNFDSYYNCAVHCVIGACCWQEPLHPERNYGYDKENYDRYGYNLEGFNRNGEAQTIDNAFGGIHGLFNWNGYDHQGYDIHGFNKEGLDRYDYDRRGYHEVSRFNLTGYNAFGDYDGIIDYDEDGYDTDGYNRIGLNCYGYNRDGWDYYGLCAGWSYSCKATSLHGCQQTEQEFPHLKRRVIKFSPGEKCEDINCNDQCGCNFLDYSYKVGEKLNLGCSECECHQSGSVICSCSSVITRKEIHDLTKQELLLYQQAIKHLQMSTGHPSKWQELTSLYSKHISQSHGSAQFLPWHRFFLRLVEMELQNFSCNITIPYFDWTMNAGDLESSIVWQANYFGGNGDKEYGDCVRNHPFKNHYPQYWLSCLRRHFNNSIHLPDAVNLQLILNQETYDEFRIQIEAISSLFHLFVGGHMASPEAPYDPIFLSYYAFIDKLWYNWETSKQNVIPRYPSVLRYIPMVPFGITPDDVLLSEKQLCVTYASLIEGAHCNISEPRVDNMPRGHPSSTSIFDDFGFDKEGYNKNGYDKQGWDMKGFRKDGYNRDGFDAFGYDRNGYNRYGFDKHGCTSSNFCLDPSSEQDISIVYNEYGYNQLGFDQDGFDIFGFNRHGFDENDCSYYYNGPFYPLFKKWADDQLSTMSESDLLNIPRTCPQISSVPEWWLSNIWFERENQKASLKNYEETIVIHHPVYEFPEYSVQLGWQPSTPDERFCFHLNYYLGCKLGAFVMECPVDICSSVSCPKHPEAKCYPYRCDTCEPRFYSETTGNDVDCFEHGCFSINDTFHRESDVWVQHPCTYCSCKKGVEACSKVRCVPDPYCDHPVILTNQCCARCEGCYFEGKIYVNGGHFTHPNNHCIECLCQKGNVSCQNVTCKLLSSCDSEDIGIPKGHCCPICAKCGQIDSGASWKEGECHTCSCEDNQVICHSQECPKANCTYPAQSAHHCCAVCEDCQYEGLYIKNGDNFKPDPCNECECKNGSVHCKTTVCTMPKCKQQLIVEGECCPVCFTGCQWKGSYYAHGEIFTPLSSPCLNCSCEDNEVNCKQVTCPPLALCKSPVTPKGKCCASECPKCEVNGKEYLNGEKWIHDNVPCLSCTCVEGVPVCTTTVHCDKMCNHGLKENNQCCSLCTDCLYEDRLVPNGMSFMALDNPCDICHCKDGNITCQSTKQQCPQLLCHEKEVPENACCPICKRCIDKVGRIIEHGRQWMHPSDSCQICTCREGNIRCERMICSTQCSYPIPRTGHCCPDCSGCLYEGKIYYNGAAVKVNDTCTKCTCYNGNIECESIHCPLLTCSSPIILKEECCPVCYECFLYNQTYSDGEVFVPVYDPCLNCTCKKGEVDCKRTDHFCNPQCSHPIRVRGSCCPLCDGCEYERRNYRNGQKFTPPDGDNCVLCECLNGYVSCSRKKCPSLTCQNPFKVPDECCEQCPETCVAKGIEYLEGDTWEDSDDECLQCQCLHSRIYCQRSPCPTVPCQHPAAPFGECCPYCEHCEFTHRLYRNGQEFFHVDDPCQQCICQDGTVTCQVVPCGPVLCQVPILHPHQCCPICPQASECYIGTKTYQPQQTFLDPHNSCQECVCMDGGDVVCYQMPCPEVNCPNPISGPCCESCEGCSYANHSFPNHRRFTDPFDPCRNCYCENGHVSCQQIQCQPTSCKSPSTLEGECCPRCLDCIYENNIYAKGEVFTSPIDACQECKCIYPKVSCTERVCPIIQCTHPVLSACCKECSDCLYEKHRYFNGQSFIDPLDKCRICLCKEGNVTCEKTVCPTESCSHPVNGSCCLECSDCFFENRHYSNWQTFLHPSDFCQECKCHLGNVSCQRKKCQNVTCTHGIERKCCKECTDCHFNGTVILNGRTVPDAEDVCRECMCKDGSVQCYLKACPSVHCHHPTVSECCLTCDSGCFYSGQVYDEGSTFDDEDTCKICSCKEGTMNCFNKPCPEVKCTNPIQGECCLKCPTVCFYDGEEISNGSYVPHPTDHCQECICKDEEVICKEKVCSPVTCPHPSSDGCCEVCEECEFEDEFRPQDVVFEHPKDRCQTCVCKDGHVTCAQKECDTPICTNPITLPGSCCPECRGCFLLGNTYEHGSSFINPVNNCEDCMCIESEIVCHKKACLHNCSHPIPYTCCPECNNCLFEGTIYSSGENFHPDACRTCVCISGNVQCVTEDCPELTCALRTKLLDQCCEICRGCVFEGQEYEDGGTWISPLNPCLSCHCQNGIVSCTELHCLVPCENPQPVPNECCPVCPDCEVDGKIYQTGDIFTPSTSPCDICTCDGGKLHCITRECPELENCPREAIRGPSNGECCPTCAGFSTNCTQNSFGKQVKPSNDPCIICECKEDFSWICIKETCPLLSCPDEYIVHTKDECCPNCEACISKIDEEIHKPNELWTPFLEPCLLCKCENGQEKCHKIECPPISCKPNEVTHKESGECCESCIAAASLSCFYGNVNYTDQQSWKPNVCTVCICEMGKVTCHTERCMPLNCPADYIPSVDPGHCCPKCIPRPATCLAFGDPHYRTYDGALIHFQGTCRYVLSSDCLSGNFTVEVQNSNRGIEGVSWTESVTIKLHGIVIDLWQGSVVSINQQRVTLPYFNDPQVYVEKTGNSVLVNTNVGLKVLWNGDSSAEISISGTYKQHTCGLCGNFNSYPQDDMKLRSGQIVLSAAVFGNSWKTEGNQLVTCKDVDDFDPCSKGGYHARKHANEKCAILKGPKFAPCHRAIPPEPYYSSCVYDLCACAENEDCLCDILSTYSQECVHAGVALNWRSSTLCAIACPEDSGLMFDECGPVCTRTCENKDVPVEVLDAQCFKPCVPGCQCSADKVLHNNHCIDPKDCP